MLRYLFAVLLLVHGVIHLMGFTKAFGLAEIEQLTMPITKFAGMIWLTAAALFIITLVVYLAKADWWWMIGFLAVFLSQILIILSWTDAKFGTIANLIILLVIIIAYSDWEFHRTSMDKVQDLLPREISGTSLMTEELISDLPAVVQTWLQRSQVMNKEKSASVYLTQMGKMRTKPDGNWIPFQAEQWFTPQEPGFVWLADVKTAPGIHLSGRDIFIDGTGQMVIKLLSIIPVVHATGEQINQGTLIRFLAEICWFPSAALSKHIRWEPIDSLSARAIMSYKGTTGSGIFTFSESGDIHSFMAKRYYNRKEGAILADWYIEINPQSFKMFDGIRVGSKAEVTWKLDEGDYTWLQLEIDHIEFNRYTSENYRSR